MADYNQTGQTGTMTDPLGGGSGGLGDLVNATKGQALNTGALVKAFGDLSTALSANALKAGGTPTLGQIAQWTSANTLVGNTMSGDGTINSSGAITITKLGGQTVSLAGSLNTSGAYSITLTATGSTNITLPTSGTLLTSTGSPSSGQVAIWSSSAILGGYTVSGDGTLSGSGALAVTKTGGVAFAASATTDTTVASNISSGLLPAARIGYWTILTSGNTLSNVNTVQNVFPAGQASISLAASTTYEFEGFYLLTRAAGTTSHTTTILFGSTQTLTAINFVIDTSDVTGNALSATSHITANSVSGAIATAANTSATENLRVWVRGILITGTAPTLTPQFQYSAAPGGAPTVGIGSYFRIAPLGSGSVTTVGSGWA